MSEQNRTITESEYSHLAPHASERLRAALADIGITVVPDPAPPLPTEPGTRWLGDDGRVWEVWSDGKLRCLESPSAKPKDHAPFERLETQAEGDARRDAEVLAILRRSDYSERLPLIAGWLADNRAAKS